MNNFHKPVLLQEVLDNLQIKRGKKYIDATVGGGGHAFHILKLGGLVLGLDHDREALNFCKKYIPNEYKPRLRLVKENFCNIEKIAKKHSFEKVAGILFDLGVSSYQLKTGKRGFSFRYEGPLDMRMDQDIKTSAAKIINDESYEKLKEIFTKFGEEPLSSQIAQVIISSRLRNKIATTTQLGRIIERVYEKYGVRTKIHPATRAFQAIRIALNKEIEVLKEGIEGAIRLLDLKGRLAVISYHSLEDRIVKLKFKSGEKLKIITKKPIRATFEEIKENPSARSAKLRVAEKI